MKLGLGVSIRPLGWGKMLALLKKWCDNGRCRPGGVFDQEVNR